MDTRTGRGDPEPDAALDHTTGPLTVAGALRRVRRLADLSQRQLAAALGVSASVISQAEAGRRDLPVTLLRRAAELGGVRLALLDTDGRDVADMSDSAARDGGGRRFPAHLDTRHGDEDWWAGPERYTRRQPTYTFDRDRARRDRKRRTQGTPEDHLLPRPGDALEERSRARRAAAWARHRQRLSRLAAESPRPPAPELVCTCPPDCDDLLDDVRVDTPGRPPHVDRCPCRCDTA
ncbi:helix-turn-helix domain-containing protein [Modestobacter italicus]|uniref:helix-turn-helix domain-containing protein n=1 Tax=Modestobacter italicus (strain DSM 44449 / CECT 9708 / BC 501) TaxID=2732864 RepID=UPI001C93EBB1|nr:helix-turn-helix transcriptional regulator [Modestobacter italicus]